MVVTVSWSSGAVVKDWKTATGCYAPLNQGSQLPQLTLQYVGQDTVVFAFLPSSGDPLAGVIPVGQDNVGVYQNEENGDQLAFALEGDRIVVSEVNTWPMAVAGTYVFQDAMVEANAQTAMALLAYLSPEITGLPPLKEAYRLEYGEEEIDTWFHELKAREADSDTVLARFYLAKDYSAIYRMDTNLPTLIFGSAQSMLGQEGEVSVEEQNFATEEENKQGIEGMDAPILHDTRLVVLTCRPKSPLIGETARVVVKTPGNLPYQVTVTSSNPDVVAVDEDGQLQVKKPGQTVISGKVTIYDGQKDVSFELTVSPPAIEFLVGQSLTVGETLDLVARVTGVKNPPALQYEVQDPSIVAMQGDTMIAKKPGQTEIRITAGGDYPLSETYPVVVEEVAVEAAGTPSKGLSPAAGIGISILIIGLILLVVGWKKKWSKNGDA